MFCTSLVYNIKPNFTVTIFFDRNIKFCHNSSFTFSCGRSNTKQFSAVMYFRFFTSAGWACSVNAVTCHLFVCLCLRISRASAYKSLFCVQFIRFAYKSFVCVQVVRLRMGRFLAYLCLRIWEHSLCEVRRIFFPTLSHSRR